jgi:2-polyprenyl-3-methyl-5-hydroxy-6-metoxy-1,4-benzoquinol methylase
MGYVGSELETFRAAVNWKAYLGSLMTPYVRGAVLEVGAGIGSTTEVLFTASVTTWICLEPDPELAGAIDTKIKEGVLPDWVRVQVGTIQGLEEAAFDTILYVDVLEHIEDDRGELERAAARLRPGGHLLVLAPSHQWLFSPFDSAIGHFRRYTKRGLRELSPPGLRLVRLRYLDSVGLLASAANRFLLRSSSPSLGQIRFWDRFLVRGSRTIDPLLAYSVGKSVLGVWATEVGT